MAHFYKRKYRGLECVLTPRDFRRFPPFRSFPYWKGTEVRLSLRIKKIDPDRDTRLNNLLLGYRYPSGLLREIFSHKEHPDNSTEFDFTSQPIPSNGALEIWLDVPEHGDAVKLADLEGNWRDWLWYTVLAAIIGMIVGALGSGFIL